MALERTVSEYQETVPAHRRERFDSILGLVRRLYPEAQESLRYKMPTFESASGWVALANQKHYISLYTCKPEHIEGFKALYPEIKTGKGCINLRDTHEFQLEDLAPVIQSAMEGAPP